jgi:uncharacterized membrane protein
LGAAVVVSRLVPSWLGVLLVVGGLLSIAIGFSVGYEGLESGFQDAVGIALQLVILVVSHRAREPGTRAARTSPRRRRVPLRASPRSYDDRP